jgi:hypothetical protein
MCGLLIGLNLVNSQSAGNGQEIQDNQTLLLTYGTILEQTLSESLTRGYSIFVHYNMLCHAGFNAIPPVASRQGNEKNYPQFINRLSRMKQVRRVTDRPEFGRNVNNWKKPGTKSVRIRETLIFPSCSIQDVDSSSRPVNLLTLSSAQKPFARAEPLTLVIN